MDNNNQSYMRVLLIEDSELDAHLLQSILSDIPALQITWVTTLAAGLRSIKANQADVVLVDLTLPDSNGVVTVSKLRKAARTIPILVLTSLDDGNIALEAVQLGAQDYLLKGRPSADSIYRSILYAIERTRADEAERKLVLLQQREDFIAMLAHDLRTPLIGANRILTLMLDGTLDPITENQKALLSQINSSNKSLLMMISNVLDFHRFQSYDEKLVLTAVDLNKLTNECIVELQPLALSKQINLEGPQNKVRSANADALAMRRVIGNLIGNAIKFTQNGGSVKVEITEEGESLVLTVTDTGIGIPEDKQANLFNRFFQADEKYRSSGSGLGLFLSRQLMESQGGNVTCKSTPGIGSTFTVSIGALASAEVALPVS